MRPRAERQSSWSKEENKAPEGASRTRAPPKGKTVAGDAALRAAGTEVDSHHRPDLVIFCPAGKKYKHGRAQGQRKRARRTATPHTPAAKGQAAAKRAMRQLRTGRLRGGAGPREGEGAAARASWLRSPGHCVQQCTWHVQAPPARREAAVALAPTGPAPQAAGNSPAVATVVCQSSSPSATQFAVSEPGRPRPASPLGCPIERA